MSESADRLHSDDTRGGDAACDLPVAVVVTGTSEVRAGTLRIGPGLPPLFHQSTCPRLS